MKRFLIGSGLLFLLGIMSLFGEERSQVGKITVSDYCEFLNAKAENQAEACLSILRSGEPGNYHYEPAPITNPQETMTWLSWNDAFSYCAWKQAALPMTDLFPQRCDEVDRLDPELKSNQLTFQLVNIEATIHQASGSDVLEGTLGTEEVLEGLALTEIMAMLLPASALPQEEASATLSESASRHRGEVLLPTRELSQEERQEREEIKKIIHQEVLKDAETWESRYQESEELWRQSEQDWHSWVRHESNTTMWETIFQQKRQTLEEAKKERDEKELETTRLGRLSRWLSRCREGAMQVASSGGPVAPLPLAVAGVTASVSQAAHLTNRVLKEAPVVLARTNKIIAQQRVNWANQELAAAQSKAQESMKAAQTTEANVRKEEGDQIKAIATAFTPPLEFVTAVIGQTAWNIWANHLAPEFADKIAAYGKNDPLWALKVSASGWTKRIRYAEACLKELYSEENEKVKEWRRLEKEFLEKDHQIHVVQKNSQKRVTARITQQKIYSALASLPALKEERHAICEKLIIAEEWVQRHRTRAQARLDAHQEAGRELIALAKAKVADGNYDDIEPPLMLDEELEAQGEVLLKEALKKKITSSTQEEKKESVPKITEITDATRERLDARKLADQLELKHHMISGVNHLRRGSIASNDEMSEVRSIRPRCYSMNSEITVGMEIPILEDLLIREQIGARAKWMKLLADSGVDIEDPLIVLAWKKADRAAVAQETRRKLIDVIKPLWETSHRCWKLREEADELDVKNRMKQAALEKATSAWKNKKLADQQYLWISNEAKEAQTAYEQVEKNWWSAAMDTEPMTQALHDLNEEDPKLFVAKEELKAAHRSVNKRLKMLDRNPQENSKVISIEEGMLGKEATALLQKRNRFIACFDQALSTIETKNRADYNEIPPFDEQLLETFAEESKALALKAAREKVAEEERKFFKYRLLGRFQAVQQEAKIAEEKNKQAAHRSEGEALWHEASQKILAHVTELVATTKETVKLFKKEAKRLRVIEEACIDVLETERKATLLKIEKAIQDYAKGEKQTWYDLTEKERDDYQGSVEQDNIIYELRAKKPLQEAQYAEQEALKEERRINRSWSVSAKQKEEAHKTVQEKKANLMKVKAQEAWRQLALQRGRFTLDEIQVEQGEAGALEELQQAKQNLIMAYQKVDEAKDAEDWREAIKLVQEELREACKRLLQAYDDLPQKAPRWVIEATEEARKDWISDIEKTHVAEECWMQKIASAQRRNNILSAGIAARLMLGAGIGAGLLITSPVWLPLGAAAKLIFSSDEPTYRPRRYSDSSPKEKKYRRLPGSLGGDIIETSW